MTSPSFLANASAVEVASLIRRGEVSSVQITEACLARIEALDPTYGAFVTVLSEEARRQAQEADAAVRRHAELGSLHGVPVNVKDVFLTRGVPTTAGSRYLSDFSPENVEDATCVQRLRRAGAIMLGKVCVGSGMVESNQDSTREHPPRNPWSPDCTPGGSSSGSVVSVALGMGYGSIGTDRGGSLRIPAALTGVVGLKPTYGRVSQYGNVFGLSRRLDHVGPLTRTVADAALLLGVVSGHDPKDPTSVDTPVPDFLSFVKNGSADPGLRVGWASDGGSLGAESDVLTRVAAGVQLLREVRVNVTEIGMPSFSEELYYQLILLDEWEAHDVEESDVRGYSAYIRAGLRGRRRKVLDDLARHAASIRATYRELFERFEVLVLPTVPLTARRFEITVLPWREQHRHVLDLYLSNTWVFNLTGHPAISLPCGFCRRGLPVGLQVVGRHFEESTLLRVAGRFEAATGGFPLPQVS